MKWNDYFVYKRELILSLAAHIGKWPLLQAVMSVICCEIGNQRNTSYFPHSVFTFCCCIVAFFIPISRSQVSICNAGFEIDIAKHLFEATQAMLEFLVLLELLLLVLQLPLRSKCFEFRCQRRCRRLCRRFGRPISQSTLCDGHGWGIHTLIRTHTRTHTHKNLALALALCLLCCQFSMPWNNLRARAKFRSFVHWAPHSTVAETKRKFYQPFIGAVICMRKPFKITWSMQPANS